MGLLKILVNRSTGQLVKSVARPEQYVLPPLVQGDTLSIEFSLVEDNPALGLGVVSLVNLASYSLKIGLGPQPTGDETKTPIALQNTWTLDSNQTTYIGDLSLATAEVKAFLGTETAKQAWFEIEVRNSSTGFYETVYGTQITLRAHLIIGTSVVPIPGDTALGSVEAAATYVPRYGTVGGSILLISEDGLTKILLYAGNDGTFHADPVP